MYAMMCDVTSKGPHYWLSIKLVPLLVASSLLRHDLLLKNGNTEYNINKSNH